MAKLVFLIPHSLFLVLVAVGMIVQTAKGDKVCTEAMGLCQKDCDARCKAKHIDGDGTCDYTNIPALCSCNYFCDYAKPTLKD
ncbi:low-molecular-weight cysteine-rich 59 [Quillaja saponaria]|uniref:Defensin-like protein n=1 Tax=Quillaja saponaria TaxID=32244 RepID=A0AAD7KNE3_QUISA|nr:low-molecular-weight cysteine-rich 59 [Quillaja saponaria]